MNDRALPTKDRLILSAATLFRTRGYHGVGLADLLADAKAPKGSLYHHFPNGKSDLAMAAATSASDEMLRLIAASFDGADTFKDGATTLCYKLAKLFDITGWDTCPIAATLFEGPDNEEFRAHASHIYEGWIAEVHDHAARSGLSDEDARAKSEHLFMLIQGGWTLARARRNSDVIRQMTDRL
ncbi:TetR/AcrR family transcriptional regulator [Tateyamaria omphalii]|uniref:TetR/AcrR family transcriptional regulator n=1 Tax=Tateyamaria omphalii TaxID=299262 RepID=UPI001C9947A7|nr:TetR/AcrR family transcriptional regulator [Tateyamaria omphalii]MBY5934629.1 TetR/AcrR family transcriptional regulator [Tateyamaria omphalii]